MLEVKKIRKATGNAESGHRGSGLNFGSGAAGWGVFVGGVMVASLVGRRGGWLVMVDGREASPMLGSRAAAKDFAVSMFQ